MSRIDYTYIIETLDAAGDIADIEHYETLPALVAALRPVRRTRINVALVRDVLDREGSVVDRQWAYVGADGRFGPFVDASGRETGDTPPKARQPRPGPDALALLDCAPRATRRKSAAKGEPYVVTCTIMIDAPTLASARQALSRALADVPGFRKGQYAPWAARAVRA